MEIYFLDIGQGTCQIILLGHRSAIVVDCGAKNDKLALQFLKRYGVEYIPWLVVSHSHNDHIGGAVSILGDYQDRIDRIGFVQDDLFLDSSFWLRLTELRRDGVFRNDQLTRLEPTDRPQVVWRDRTLNSRLRAFSPTAAENLDAQVASKQNLTSAVLVFDCGNSRIVFAADSEMEQWREIRKKMGKRISCDVLAIAHHGGKMHDNLADLQWLYTDAIRPEVAVLSVGTSNQHGHPREDVITALRSVNSQVICTQITGRCCDDLEVVRPGVLRPINLVGLSSPSRMTTSTGNSKNVACAGTVMARVSADSCEVDRLGEHQAAVTKLCGASVCQPLCRR